MQLEHSFTVSAPIDTAWEAMMDLQGVAECFPGATVTSAEGDEFEGSVKVKLGPIALVYKGGGTFTERDDAAHHAVIEAKGRDKRGNGTAGATATISMSADGETTRTDVVTDLKVTGKPAQFGRGVMQDVSDKLLGQFVECLEQRLTGPQEPSQPSGESDTATAAAAAGSTETDAATTSEAPAPASTGSRPSDDALDLGSAVLPTVARTYAPYAVAGLIGLVLGLLLRRRRH